MYEFLLGRIVERSGELIIRLVKGHPALELYLVACRRILGMIPRCGDHHRRRFAPDLSSVII